MDSAKKCFMSDILTNKKVVITRLIFGLCALLLLGFTVFSMPIRHGDGHEYSVTVQAFLNHFSADIRIDDIAACEKLLEEFPCQGYVSEIFQGYKQQVFEKADGYQGLYRAESGKYYGCHFWGYAAYVACVERVVTFFGANPLAGFQIANAILLIVVLGYCLFAIQGSLQRRVGSAAAFFLGGVLFYLKWTHPEVFIAAFLFLGFTALYQRVFRVAFFCLAFAAIQVVTLWIAFAAIPLLILLQYKSESIGQIRMLSKKWWTWFCAALPAASLIFYYLNYGRPSVIGSQFVDIRLVSFSHLYSFWFDLDQGVFVGVPWLLPILIVFLFRLKKVSQQCRMDLVTAVFGALCICIPLLVNINVNSGGSVFQRYALYAVCPLTAWAGFYFIEIIKKRWGLYLLVAFAVIYTIAFDGPNADEDYMRHKPWTKLLLENAPNWYNPEPGIFYARTGGIPGWFRMGSDGAVVSRDRHGVVRKILFPVDRAEKAMSNLCSGRLLDINGVPVDYATASHERYGWAYLNGHFLCDGVFLDQHVSLNPQYDADIASGIDFTRDGFPSFVEYASGFSGYEKWARWSDGPVVALKIKGTLPKRFEIRFYVGAFASNAGKSVKVTIAGVTEEFVVDRNDPKEYLIQFVLPEKVVNPVIQIQPPNPVSPKSLGMSGDTRLLGLSFVRITFN